MSVIDVICVTKPSHHFISHLLSISRIDYWCWGKRDISSGSSEIWRMEKETFVCINLLQIQSSLSINISNCILWLSLCFLFVFSSGFLPVTLKFACEVVCLSHQKMGIRNCPSAHNTESLPVYKTSPCRLFHLLTNLRANLVSCWAIKPCTKPFRKKQK